MDTENRPTSVTVIGWAWIVLGVLGGLLALTGLVAMLSMGSVAPDDGHMAGFMLVHPVIAVSQVALAALAVVAGGQFLALKAWARAVLEALSWLAIALLAVMALSMLFGGMLMEGGQWAEGGHMGGRGHFMGGFFMLLIGAIYAAPFVIMLVYLRGPEVKGAMVKPS